jgi:hypothetical protein
MCGRFSYLDAELLTAWNHKLVFLVFSQLPYQKFEINVVYLEISGLSTVTNMSSIVEN